MTEYQEKPDKIVYCVDCDQPMQEIERKKEVCGVRLHSTRARCYPCGYERLWKDHRTCPQPFQEPFPRVFKDGRLPKRFWDAVMKHIGEEQ